MAILYPFHPISLSFRQLPSHRTQAFRGMVEANKKRKVDSSASEPEALVTTSTPTSTTNGQPLSAVAARRAAIAAAQANASATTSHASASTSTTASEDGSGSSSDEDAEVLNQVLASSDEESNLPAKPKGQLDKNGKGKFSRSNKGKQKVKDAKPRSKQGTRYFASAADGVQYSETDQAPVASTSNGKGRTAFVAFDPMDESHDESGTTTPTNKPRTGRGKRQRREKSAFVDPACMSSFTPESNVNVIQLQLASESSPNAPEQGVLYCLRSQDMLVFHGALTITPIFGSVSILSASLDSELPTTSSNIDLATCMLDSSVYPVFASSSHPLPPVHPCPLQRDSRDLPTSLSLPDGNFIALTSFEAVVLVRDHFSGIEGVESVLKNGGLGFAAGMWEVEPAVGSVQRTPECGGSTWKLILEPTPSLTLLRAVEGWEPALSAFATQLDPIRKLTSIEARNDDSEDEETGSKPTPRLSLLTEGPKRVGKSTFSKLLLHQLLSRFEAVAYLDTDLGQPEFTPPGFVSLSVVTSPVLGPAFTHLAPPTAAHFLGATSPANDPSAYLAAIKNLHTTYEMEVEYSLAENIRPTRRRNGHVLGTIAPATATKKIRDRIPLVINTHGWNKGLGADLLNKIKLDLSPTHVFAFEQEEDLDISSSYSTSRGASPTTVLRLAPAPPNPLESKWSSADLRTLSLVSYFHSVLPRTPSLFSSWDFSLSLVQKIPYALDWTSMISTVSIVGYEIDPDQALCALNGSLVAVIESPVVMEEESEVPAGTFPFNSSSTAPLSRSYGLGLIHSIDVSSTTLHLLTPITPPEEGSKISLVKGSDLEIPLALWLDSDGNENGVTGVEWKDVAYLSVEGGEGAGRRRVRRNLMRRGQA